METKITKAAIKRLERYKKNLEQVRDGLRDMQSEVDGLVESSDRGLAALEDAIDSLSELV